MLISMPMGMATASNSHCWTESETIINIKVIISLELGLSHIDSSTFWLKRLKFLDLNRFAKTFDLIPFDLLN